MIIRYKIFLLSTQGRGGLQRNMHILLQYAHKQIGTSYSTDDVEFNNFDMASIQDAIFKSSESAALCGNNRPRCQLWSFELNLLNLKLSS